MIRYFYKIGDIINYIDNNNDELKTQTLKEKIQINNAHYYEVQKGYNKDIEGWLFCH